MIHDEAAFARRAGVFVDPVVDVIGSLFRGDLYAAQTALDRISVNAEPNVGRVRFVAGDFWAARDDFAAALQLRRAQGADADLIESSLIAPRRADEEISRLQQPQNQVPDS